MSVRILIGDCRDKLRELPDASVNCCVTSPPYFGLRDYGTAAWNGGDQGCDHKQSTARQDSGRAGVNGFNGSTAANSDKGAMNYRDLCGKCGATRIDRQMGLEPTPDEFVAGMVAVFREVRRVLRDDGTLWLNIGDSYASVAGGYSETGSRGATAIIGAKTQSAVRKGACRAPPAGTKAKDLIGIPWMLAFALRADGWYLRQDIIWSKPNPMPESVRDRCTKAHEYIFLLSKSKIYHFDADAIVENLQTDERENYPARAKITGRGDQGAAVARGNDRGKSGGFPPRNRGLPPRHERYRESSDQSGLDDVSRGLGRNKRSVWTVPTQPFAGAHFATFPPALIEPCILAGCPEDGTVLDPFFGAGTTGLVADRLGRNCIGIELNPEYVALAEKRLRGDAGLFAEVQAA